jgi:hypothetical protein
VSAVYVVARRRTMISTNRHITSRPKQARNSGIGFSSQPTRHLACSLRSRKWVGTRGSNPLLASLRVFRVSGFEKMLVLYRPSPMEWKFFV